MSRSSSNTLHFGSSNFITHNYYHCLLRQLGHAQSASTDMDRSQDLLVCLFMAVTTVEAFPNIYFRVVVDHKDYSEHAQGLLDDLKNRIPLKKKMRNWPKRIFRKKLNFGSQPVQRFEDLRKHRNSLMHFQSTHESLQTPGPVTIAGLPNITAYKTLTLEKAQEYPETVRHFTYEIFKAQGASKDQLPHAFDAWFGSPPPL